VRVFETCSNAQTWDGSWLRESLFRFYLPPSRHANNKKQTLVKTLSEAFMLDIVLVALIVLFFTVAIGYVHFLDKLKGKTVQKQSH
jgi:hypothetical protein